MPPRLPDLGTNAARRARGHKRAGITFRDGFVHVALDLGGEGGGSPRRLAPGAAWNRIRALTLREASEAVVAGAPPSSPRELHRLGEFRSRRVPPREPVLRDRADDDVAHAKPGVLPFLRSRYRRCRLRLWRRRWRSKPKIRKLCLSGNNLGRKAARRSRRPFREVGRESIETTTMSMKRCQGGSFSAHAASPPAERESSGSARRRGLLPEDLDVSGNHIGSEGARGWPRTRSFSEGVQTRVAGSLAERHRGAEPLPSPRFCARRRNISRGASRRILSRLGGSAHTRARGAFPSTQRLRRRGGALISCRLASFRGRRRRDAEDGTRSGASALIARRPTVRPARPSRSATRFNGIGATGEGFGGGYHITRPWPGLFGIVTVHRPPLQDGVSFPILRVTASDRRAPAPAAALRRR